MAVRGSTLNKQLDREEEGKIDVIDSYSDSDEPPTKKRRSHRGYVQPPSKDNLPPPFFVFNALGM